MNYRPARVAANTIFLVSMALFLGASAAAQSSRPSETDPARARFEDTSRREMQLRGMGSTTKKTTDPKGAESAPEAPRVTIEELQSAVKIERTEFDLAGDKPQTVRLTNTLPGPVTFSIDCPLMPIAQTGITATFDKKTLKASETATLMLSAAKARAGSLPLRIVVSPTNQVLDLTVTVKP